MKKIIALFVALATVVAVVSSCGKSAANGTTGTASTTSSATTANTTTATTNAATSATTQATTTQQFVTPPPAVKSAEPDSLVFYLDFSEDNLVDNAYYADLSGNGHVGYIKGNPTQNKDTVGFDGTGKSYIYINDHADLNFNAGQSYTLEVRFKAAPEGKWACIAQKGLADNKPGYFGFWLSNKNELNMGVGVTNTKNFASDAEVGTEWHQAIIIQDTKSGTMLFYLDGELQGSTFPKNNSVPATPTKVSSVGEMFTIGSNLYDHFKGEIEYVKLYNYAVPEKELLADYPGQVFNLDREYYEYTDPETNEKFTLPYRIYYPTGYTEKDGKKYPVLLTLHGHGECGKDNVGQLRNSGGYIEYLMEKDNCIIIAPQCQCDNGVNKEWVASAHRFDITDRTLPEEATVALRAVMALMDEIKKDSRVDNDRICAYGFSMGGFGVWEILVRDPDTFAAALIFSAAGIPGEADKLLDIDIRAYHGKLDTVVPISGLELMDNAITQLGGTKFTATYFDNADHNTCLSAAHDKDGLIFDWLLSQTKAD